MNATSSPTNLSGDQLLRNIEESQIFSAEELQSHLAGLRLPASADGEAIGRELSSAGLLTPFQVEVIAQRRFDELRIGNYEVLDRLGAGGMGTVYKARHRRMKRVVALKVMSKALCQDARSVQRFQREVETLARLNHPNIVLAFDADECELGHFLVMEFVAGRDLASLVHEQGPMSVREAVDCTLQAARGMDYAHRQNVIHRDIKPANLLRDASGMVKITDLGLARLNEKGPAAAGSTSLTQAGGVVGTADYMPPEQAFDTDTVNHQSDIYSLGCTLFYFLAGAPPFPGNSVMTVLLKHREAPIPPLAALRPEVPPALDAAFQRMVAKTQGDRFATMAEVVAALEAVPLPHGEAPRPPAATTTASERPSTQVRPAMAPTDCTIELPPPGAPAPTAAPPATTVLLVEPSRTQAAIIRQYLKSLDLPVVATVGSGQEAVDQVRQHRPTAVVSAMHLKDMNGVQLAQQLAAESPAPGFLLISSAEEASTAGSLSQAGGAMLLPKPFDLDQLARALRAVTRRELKATAGGLSDSKTLLPQATSPAAMRELRAKLRVAIVDDSAAARRHERTVLEGLGFTQFAEAVDGAQAVALTARQPFDLIVTDYNMPHMDGRGLVGYLRQNPATAAIPILMVTTETDPDLLEPIRKLGVAAVCDKAFAPDTVRAVVERLFG